MTRPLPNGAAAFPSFSGTPPTCLLSPPRKTPLNGRDLHLGAGLGGPLKLQRILLNGKNPIAVALGVWEAEKMSCANAERRACAHGSSSALTSRPNGAA